MPGLNLENYKNNHNLEFVFASNKVMTHDRNKLLYTANMLLRMAKKRG